MRDNTPRQSLTHARAMRQSPTEPEKKLWSILRDRRLQGLKFRRQVPVGPYIVDFLCISHALVIEADGSQHADSSYDAARCVAQKPRLSGAAVLEHGCAERANLGAGHHRRRLRLAMVGPHPTLRATFSRKR
jgi:very-short-patch-repair endonuclease